MQTNDITRALFGYLATVTGLPVTYYVDSTETATTDHLRAYIMPAISVSSGLAHDSDVKQNGILHINVFTLASAGSNINNGNYMALLVEAFERGTNISGIEFNKPPLTTETNASNGFLMASISCEYTVIG